MKPASPRYTLYASSYHPVPPLLSVWATSLILTGGATQLYMPWGGGLILSPSVTIRCAYPAE